MTPAVRATVLVIAALAGATAAVWAGLASHALGGEAQDFWRQNMRPVAHRPSPERRRIRERRERWHEQRRIRGLARVVTTVRVVGEPGAFSGAIALRDLDDTFDSFARRTLVREEATPLPPRFHAPPLLEPREAPLAPERPERKPNNSGRRLVLIGVAVVAAIAGFVASIRVSQRGIAYG